MPDDKQELVLPGFEGLVVPDTDRAASQDFTDAKKYTGHVIRRDYPRVFESVTRALFYYKLSVRTCCDLFNMSSQTVRAIRDMVIAEGSTSAAAAFLINSRHRSQRDLVITRLVETIAERLDDPDAVKKMSMGELISYLERLESAKPARNGTDSPSTTAKSDKDDILDPDAYEILIDGLKQGKKNARAIRVEDGRNDGSARPEMPSECSTRSGNNGVCS